MKRYRPEQIVAKLRQAHVAKQHDFRGHPSTARVKGIPTALCHAERSREPALSLSDGPLRGAKPNGGLAVAVRRSVQRSRFPVGCSPLAVSPFIPQSAILPAGPFGGHQSEMCCSLPPPTSILETGDDVARRLQEQKPGPKPKANR